MKIMENLMKKDKDKAGETALDFAARKAAQDPFFLGSAFKTWQAGEQKDEAAVAVYLGIAPELLSRLALCRRPNSRNPADFGREVSRIAEHFGIAPAALANLLRRADAFEAQTATQKQPGYLMAARDYEEEEPELPKGDAPENA